MDSRRYVSQLKALLRRNLILKWRSKMKVIYLEVLFPLIMIGSLSAVKLSTPSVIYKQVPDPIPLGQLYKYGTIPRLMKVLITPNNTNVNTLLSAINDTHIVSVSETICSSVEELEEIYLKNPKSFQAGLVFAENPLENGSYVIRMPTENVPGQSTLLGSLANCRDYNLNDVKNCPSLGYYYSDFSLLQAAVDSALISVWSDGSSKIPKIHDAYLELFPKPHFEVLSTSWQSVAPIYLVLVFSPLVSLLAMNIVIEKEKKIKEGMLMMGMMHSVYWLSWFLIESVIIIFTSVLISIMVNAIGIFSNSDVAIVFLLLFLYGSSLIMLAFMLTPFFKKSKVAGTVIGILVPMFSLFYLLGVYLQNKVTSIVFYLVALLSPTAFALGIQKFSELDQSKGFKIENITEGNFSVLSSIIMMCVDILLYGLLAYYFDNVIPGEFGPKRKPWFFLLPEYWTSKSSSPDITYDTLESSPNIEPVPAELKGREAVRILNIKKVYKDYFSEKSVVAVDGISLDMYEGHITALLGHNGAGKTTLINMLTGMIPATDGVATIFGLNITNAEDLIKLRTMTGVCLQEDILFDELNAAEHLDFFCRLKGIPDEAVKYKVQKMLMDLDLKSVDTIPSKNLSGGQKRKLCVGIALVGDPQIIFLDEPSSGLDPLSRRNLWTLLKQYREGRVIILTTHFMDEADILADRKAVISRGKLRCCGSSLFLKSRFGIGYHLTVATYENRKPEVLNQIIQDHILTVACSKVTAEEISFLLPLGETDKFPTLFNSLEEAINTSSCGIKSYGISMTTLEEVFLKLEHDETDDEDKDGGDNRSDNQTEIDMNKRIMFNPVINYSPLYFQAFFGYVKVRLLLFVRNPMHIVPVLIYPAILVIISYLLMINTGPDNSLVNLSPKLYPDSNTFYMKNDTSKSLEDIVKATSEQGVSVDMLLENPGLTNMKLGYMATVVHNQDWNNWTWLINDTFIHSLPILQNILANVFWKNSTKGSDSLHLSISSQPLPLIQDADKVVTMNPNIITFIILISVLIPYISPMIAAEIVEDRENGTKKHLQISGLGFFSYWTCIFFTHSIILLVSISLIIICLVVLKVDIVSEPQAAGALTLLYLLFIPSSLLWCYVFCFLFNKYDTAKNILPALTLLGSMITAMPILIISSINGMSSKILALHYLFSFLIPFYAPSIGSYLIYLALVKQQIFKAHHLPHADDHNPFFVWENHITVIYIAQMCHVLFFSFLLYIIDTKKIHILFKLLFSDKISSDYNIPSGEDDDVKAEREKVKNLNVPFSEYPAVVVKEIRKIYHSGFQYFSKHPKTKVAIQNVSMTIDKGNVFGLLGPNGAGKTTMLKILCGDVVATSGETYLGGFDIMMNKSSALQALGYCPQHNPLWNQITLYEHLELYAHIRGMPYSAIKTECNRIIDELNISEHSKKKGKELSGGTKRKVCFAISTFGKTNIILLDEPTTGMDPKSKRFLWGSVDSMLSMHPDRAVTLTTHSMEEVEALCTRVGIMVQGGLRCLGSIQHLKNKYGVGYILDMKISSEEGSEDRIKEYVKSNFPAAELKEQFGDWLVYVIPQSGITSLAIAFQALEDGKRNVGIAEYSLNQTTLEHVFLGFAKEQELHDMGHQ